MRIHEGRSVSGPPTDPSKTGSSIPSESLPNRAWVLLLGGVAGNLAAAAMVLLNWVVSRRDDWEDFTAALGLINLAAVPLLIGGVAAWWWRRIPLSFSERCLHSLWLAGIGLAGAAVVFQEGIVCLLMAAPFYWFVLLMIVIAAGWYFGRRSDRIQVSLLPLVVVVAFVESRFAPPAAPAEFTDEIRIHAPPAAVWPHVVSFAPIPSPPDFWMFRLGLPYPVETPPGADAVGRERLCIFSQNVVFRERVTVFEPGRRLRFDIVQQPAHPELLGHFDAHWGEFELRPEPDGTTTLIGRSGYTLHTRPRWYFALWTRYLGSAVHLRVMENARRLAEAR